MGRTNCNGTSGDAEAKAETELYYNSLAKAESMLAPFCLSVDVGPTPNRLRLPRQRHKAELPIDQDVKFRDTSTAIGAQELKSKAKEHIFTVSRVGDIFVSQPRASLRYPECGSEMQKCRSKADKKRSSHEYVNHYSSRIHASQ